jgi:acyl dehydratase
MTGRTIDELAVGEAAEVTRVITAETIREFVDATGDDNPLHSDPAFAALGGFDRPILHGLCSYGFTGRALLHTLCGSDPARFQHVEARFAAPVLPGDALTVNMWVTGEGEAVFATSRQDGTVVIDQGLLRYSA